MTDKLFIMHACIPLRNKCQSLDNTQLQTQKDYLTRRIFFLLPFMVSCTCVQGSNYSQEGPPVGLYYAEIDDITKRQNQVPEPSSVEDASLHEYAVLEQPNQVALTNFNKNYYNNMHWPLIIVLCPLQITDTDHPNSQTQKNSSTIIINY